MDIYYYITQQLQGLSFLTITIRLCLSVLCGGVIGLERGFTKHQAGFRTHILVCVGASLAMLTNQYICDVLGASSDPARLGAQVISGIGFLGVGTILVTGRYRITGLTTAAGLWASACMGLALGIGFYSGAIIACILVYVVLALLPKVELHFYNKSRIREFYVELYAMEKLRTVINLLKETDILVMNTHVSRSKPVSCDGIGVYFSVKLPKQMTQDDLVELLDQSDHVCLIEEM